MGHQSLRARLPRPPPPPAPLPRSIHRPPSHPPVTPVSEQRYTSSRRRGRLAEAAASPRLMLIDGITKLALLGVIARLLRSSATLAHDHPYLKSFLYGLALYALLSSIMDGPGAVAAAALHIPVSPHFDQPWLSSSVASFWNSRWDLSAGNALRQLIYDPIMEGSLVLPPAPKRQQRSKKVENEDEEKEELQQQQLSSTVRLRRQFIGGSCCFLASGLAHELIFFYLTGHTSGGVWMSYFLVQIPIMVLERMVLKYLEKHRVELPLLLMMVYTVGVETVASCHLFWAPVEKAGVVDRVINSVDVSYAALMEFIQGWSLGLSWL